MSDDPAEIAKIVHDYIERGIGCDYDRLNSPPPPIYIKPVKLMTIRDRIIEEAAKKLQNKVDKLILQKEEKEMKATSVQKIENVNNICFSIENHPAEMGSKLVIVASTNDDIFAFEFEGPELLQCCKRAGLFTGWEKDQRIRELEEDLGRWKKEAAGCLKLRDEAQKEAYKLKQENEKLKNKLENIEPFRSLERTIKEKQQLKEEYEEKLDVLQRKYNLERDANEAHHKFFRQYAGKGTEIEFNRAIGDTDEVTYVIVDKDRYQTLKDNSNRCVMINGRSYTPSQMVDRIVELEELKTLTIENFTDEKPSTRADILHAAEKCVCGQREQDYGSPESNFQLIADLWNGYLGNTLSKEKRDFEKELGVTHKHKELSVPWEISAMDVSMMMALLKIARIKNGGGSGDSFVDLAGYAACGGEIWAGQKHQKDQN